jgi:hypothetical protein
MSILTRINLNRGRIVGNSEVFDFGLVLSPSVQDSGSERVLNDILSNRRFGYTNPWALIWPEEKTKATN